MYFLKFLSNILLKKAWNDTLKKPPNSLPDADLNLPVMKTKSPYVHQEGFTCMFAKVLFMGGSAQIN